MRLLLTIGLHFIFFTVFSQTYYSQSSADPDILTNWNTNRSGGGSTPSTFKGTNDFFVIQNGHTMTTTNDAGGRTTSGWDVGGSGSTLQIESGGILQADYEVDLGSTATFQIDNGGYYYHNNSTSTVFDGSITFSSSSTFEYQVLPSSTIENAVYGNLIFNYSSGGNGRFNTGTTGTISINGNLEIKKTSNSGADEVRCATGTSTGVTLDIAGDFNLTGGTFNFYSASGGVNGVINVGGDLLFTGGIWNNSGADNLTINLASDQATSNINLDGFTEAGSAIADTDWNIETGNTLTMLSNWEIGAGEVLTVSGQLNFGIFYTDGSGSISVSSGATLGIGAADGIDNASTGGNIHFTLGNRNISTACNIVYNGTSAQEMGDGLDDIGTLTGNIQISNTNGNVALTEDLIVGDGFDFIVDENAIVVFESDDEIIKSSGTDATINCSGTIQVADGNGYSALATSSSQAFQGFTSCTFGSSGLVVYNAAGNQTITNQFTYQNLTLTASNVSSSSNNKTSAGNLDVNGNLSIEGTADFDLGNNQLNLGGNWTAVTGTDFSPVTSTVVLDGNDHAIDTDGAEDFYNLSIAVTGTVTCNDGLNVLTNGTLSITSGTLDLGTNALQATATSRTLNMSDGTLKLAEVNATNQPNFATITTTGGTIALAAAGAMELNGGETYNNLTFSGSGTKTISSATSDINGTVYITETCTLYVENKTFGDGGTSLTMDGGYFAIEGSGTKPDIAGTYNLTGGTIDFGGTSAMTIRSPQTYNNIIVTGTDVSNSSGNYTLNNGASFTINSGAKYSVTTREIGSSGTASLIINGTFFTEDEHGFSGTTNAESVDENTINITLGSSSTIEYGRSGAQAVSNRDDYANLTFSGNGAKTMTGTPKVSGNYTLNSGNIIYGNSIEFSGTSTQSIEGDVFGTAQVILSGGGEKDLTSDASFNGTITFTSGSLDLGNNDVTLGTSSTVGSANASSYLKINGTGRVFRTITNGTDYLYPVGENPFLPVTLSCAACLNEEISIGVSDVIYDDPEDRTTTFSSAGHSNYVDKTWELNTDGVGGDLTIELQWNSSDQTTTPSSPNNMALGYWLDGTNTSWNDGSITASGISGSTYTQNRTLSNPSSGKYYLGIGSNSSPLPVQLAFFDYECKADYYHFRWQTFSEINNSHFNLEGSYDGKNFETVERIEGHGNSFEIIDYSAAIDKNIAYNYFRLAQYDFDGAFEYSKILGVTFKSNNSKNFTISNKTIRLAEPKDIQILNINGALVKSSTNADVLELNELAKGIYLLKIGNSVSRFVLD